MSSIQRKLVSGLFWVLLLNLIVKPLWILGIEVGVQNAVGAETYGFYFAIFNLAYIFNILLDAGITNFNTRNIARHPQLLRKHLSGILTVKLLLLLFYVAVTFTVGWLMGYEARQFRLLALLCFNQFLNSLILYLRSNFEGLLLFRWDSVLSVLDRLLMILICGALLWGTAHIGTAFRIEWFVYAQTAAYVATAAVALLVLARRTGLRRLRWNRAFAWLIIRKSAPFALLVLLMASYNRLDPILLSLLAPQGDTAAGVYASAFRLLDALTMVAYLVSVPLLPVYARLTHRWDSDGDQRRELSQVSRATFSLLFAFAVTASTTLSFLSQPLMQLLYSDHIEASAQVFRVLIFCFVPISFTYIFGTLLTAGGHLRQLNLFALSSLAINLLCNLLLIPRWGAVGSAWASLAAQSFMAVAQLLVACRRYALRPSATYSLRLAAYVAIIVAANLAIAAIGFPLGWHLVAAAAVATIAALALRLVDLKALKEQLLSRPHTN